MSNLVMLDGFINMTGRANKQPAKGNSGLYDRLENSPFSWQAQARSLTTKIKTRGYSGLHNGMSGGLSPLEEAPFAGRPLTLLHNQALR